MESVKALSILDESGGPPTSGGIFALDHASSLHTTVEVGDGWTVKLTEGSRNLLVRGGTATSYIDARESALSYAQRGLDLLSTKGLEDLSVVNAGDAHEIWWLTPHGVELRFVVIQTVFNVDVPPVTVTVTDSAGNVTSSARRPPTEWHPSFRYYRLSQITDDLIDAYRNLFLAFESVLDTIEPMRMKPSGKRGEQEREWLGRALKTAGNRINLDGYALPGVGAPEDRIIDELYQKVRTAVFHAKGSRRLYLPGDSTDRDQVDAARKRLVNLYLALANEFLGLHRHMGGLFTSGFHHFIAGGLDTEEGRLVVHVSGEAISVNEGQVIRGQVGPLHSLATRREPELDAPFIKSFVGRVSATDIGMPQHVKQVVVTNRDHEALGLFTYDQVMSLRGVSGLEVHLGLRARNQRLPKELYGM